MSRLAHLARLAGLSGLCVALSACAGAPDVESGESADELRRGQSILRVPLLDAEGKFLSSHNDALEREGLPTIDDDFIEFDSTNLERGRRKWAAVSTIVDDAQMKDIDVEMLNYAEPFEYERRDSKGICWKGNAIKAIGITSELTDSVFSDQLSVHGWRYKAQKEMVQNVDEADMPSIWREWRGRGEAILMITASSDDGSEMNVGLIPKCR